MGGTRLLGVSELLLGHPNLSVSFRCFNLSVRGGMEFGGMEQYKEVMAHIETLNSHVARLEGVIHVMLEQIEAGTIQEVAAEIRAELSRKDSI